MNSLRISLFCLLVLSSAAAQELLIEEAGRQNIFLNDDRAQVHLVHQPEGRTVFAFPSENSGVGFWYEGRMRYLPETLKSVSDPTGQTVEAEFEVTEPVRMKSVLLDSLRVLRDHNNGADTPAIVEAARKAYGESHGLTSSWAVPSMKRSGSTLEYSRTQPGHGSYRLQVQSKEVQWEESQALIPGGRVKISARCPFPRPESLPLQQILHRDFTPGDSHREKASLQALNFLANNQKMMAGSWRFLTYFGRDTLISLGMLEPVLSDQALENGIRSVLVRLSPEGVVAHEEDIGSWAEWRHLQESPPSHSLDPVYDYKMIDDDLLLPVTLHRLKYQGRAEVWQTLFSDPQAREAIARNAEYVLGKLSSKQPLLLLPGEMVGEWRDSENGLAHGNDAYSVNGALTVPALQALEQIFSALDRPAEAARARKLIPTYREIAARFWMEIPGDAIATRLTSFGETLSVERRLGWQKLLADLSLPNSLWVPVLSFDPDRSPNQVSHSDVAFNLFYGELSSQELDRIVTFLEQPFPVGLLTPIGPVVANPILSPDPEHHSLLGFGQYHGMVVWSWQSAMLQFGLIRQAQEHPEYKPRIDSLIEALAEAENRAGELATSELWAVQLTPEGVKARGYGVAGDQTESNAMQLWSTVYPALRHVRDSYRE